MATPVDIRELTREEVTALVSELGEKPYRAKQVWEWLWKKSARSFEDMSDLSKAFRARGGMIPLRRPVGRRGSIYQTGARSSQFW